MASRRTASALPGEVVEAVPVEGPVTVIAPLPQLDQLAAEFPAGVHKSRVQGGKTLTYLSIDATIGRFNQVLGAGWSTHGNTTLTPLGEGKYLAFTELRLFATVDGADKSAYGVGAMVNSDPDMAAKTALAEAIKKAGHQLGVGLYLWDEEARGRIEAASKRAKMSAAALKQEVYKRAKEALGKDKPTAKDISDLFGVDPADLGDKDVLLGILERADA